MIIRFSVENWMSYSEPVAFSMIATRELQHKERIPVIDKYKMKVLPIAVLYGGNASGKTNFFHALRFVKKMVSSEAGAQPHRMIDVEPFRLDNEATEKPSRFIIEILVNETIYELSFALTRKKVVEEKLVRISSSSEKVLYDRQGDNPNFDRSIVADEALKYAFKGTRDNQLFLTNSVSQKIDVFRPVYNWFKDNLVLIAPDTRFSNYDYFIDEEHPLYSIMNEMLPMLDTGIIGLGGEDVPFENIPLPNSIKNKIREEIEEDKPIRIMSPSEHMWYIIKYKEGELFAKKLVTYHENTGGDKTKFEMQSESDGTRRVIDLLPAFLDVTSHNSKKVYIIDEVNRSLHTLLSKQLIELYLGSCSGKSRSQLLITTHDILLMDQDIFRRDEMWVTERNPNGSSIMFSFSEYKDIRKDKDIRKSYLHGRLGGIPKFLMDSSLTSCKEVD